jgi:cell division protein FtsQ
MTRFSKLLIFSFLLLIFTTYLPNKNTNSESIFFSVNKILIEGNQIIDPKQLVMELQFLRGKNLLFIDKKLLEMRVSKFDFISSFYLKKIYPNTVKIVIKEKKPIGIYLDGMNKFFITEKGNFIEYIELELYKNLPLVYGKKNDFHIFLKKIKSLGIEVREIKSFFFFEIGRWDIIFKNNKVIKLPVKNYENSLKNFMTLKKDINFNRYEIFDYRISDQLILK